MPIILKARNGSVEGRHATRLFAYASIDTAVCGHACGFYGESAITVAGHSVHVVPAFVVAFTCVVKAISSTLLIAGIGIA
jgi:hypothetical protein